MSQHGLEIGSLDVVNEVWADEGYTITVLSRGASFGSAQAVVKEIIAMLADGNLATYDRAGNRVATFNLEIKAREDGVALAKGEKALRAELYRPNTVTWTPPVDGAPSSVYEVITSHMDPVFDDVDELLTRRVFLVTLTCAPFARSADETTVDAPAPPPETETAVTLNDCSTTAGWTATKSTYSRSTGTVTEPIAVADGGSYVYATATGSFPGVELKATLAPTSLAATPYLVAELSATMLPTFLINGATPNLVMTQATTSGTVKYVFDTEGISLTTFTATITTTSTASKTVTINAFNLSATDTLPNVTSRQLTRVIEPGGTERTPASIRVEAPDGTSSLLTTLVHTSPEDGSGYSPPLRRWRVSGNTVVADSSVLSGAYESLSPNPFAADVPISSIPHDGYIIAARVFSTITQTVEISWSVTTIVPDYPGYPGPLPADSGQETVTLFENSWTVVGLGVTTLPTMRTTAMDASVRVIIGHPAADGSLSIDEGWIFRAGEDCALTLVDGIFRPLLRLESPIVDTPVPTVLFGDDQATIHPGGLMRSMGTHVLSPGGTAVFTATEGVTNPATSATFYRRWHSNAAE